jgi:glycosyltransferase involved in cell wall biosynthesis
MMTTQQLPTAMEFSVLMSLYSRETPSSLECALKSITSQTLPPPEVILVIDGLIGEELESIVQLHLTLLPIKIVRLPKNVGLAGALNEGLKHCSYDLVARFDTDDWCSPERFEAQFRWINKHPDVDVLGTWIAEFEVDPNVTSGLRKVPLEHAQIARFAQIRNPMNHMTVMYRKSAVNSAGGYQALDLMEDYWLWVRMILNGSKFANLPQVFVHARAGAGLLARRGGMRYVKSEIKAQRLFLAVGFITFPRALYNLVLRVLPRLVPGSVRGILYRVALRSR